MLEKAGKRLKTSDFEEGRLCLERGSFLFLYLTKHSGERQ